MLGSMLGVGEDRVVTPESQFIWDVFKSVDQNSKSTEIIKKISENWRYKIWDTNLLDFEINMHECMDDIYAYCIEKVVTNYAENQGISDAKIWVDHTPESIGHIDFLSGLFNDAKFIHIIRDGRGVASSFKNLNWGPNTIEDSAIWWSAKISMGLAAEKKYSSDKLMTIKYEDILLDPEKELIRICDFANIKYNENMVHGKSFLTPKYTKVQHVLVGGELNKSKVHSWKEVLTEREIEIFEYKVSELLAYVGYDLEYGVKAMAPTKIENMKYRAGRLKNIQNYLIQKYRKLTRI